EDERCGEQDADQAGDECEPVGKIDERLEVLSKIAELIPAGWAGIDGETSCEPVPVVGVRHLDAGRHEQGCKHGEDAVADERIGSVPSRGDPGHDRTASRAELAGAAFPQWYPR